MRKQTFPPQRPSPRALRADALHNRERLLEIAHAVIARHGIETSLREIARQAEVGPATLFRHFPTREALLEALLRRRFDALQREAEALERAASPLDGLTRWLRLVAESSSTYRGAAGLMMATIRDKRSALHASCAAVESAGEPLLRRAQDAGQVRSDIDGMDLFALVNAAAWAADQAPRKSARADHFLRLIMEGLSSRR
jgi:AcrR family transcriptional regulator